MRRIGQSALGLVGLGLAAAAEAQFCRAPDLENRRQVWSGEVIVGSVGQPTPVAYGYTSTVGTLDDTEFDFGASRYTIDRATVGARIPGGLNPFAGELRFSLTRALTELERDNLTLHVCDDDFAFSDAVLDSANHSYVWADSGLDWSRHGRYTLYLSVPANLRPAAPDAPMLVSAAGTRLTVRWNEPINIGAPISRYYVHYRPEGRGWMNHWSHEFVRENPATTTTIGGLDPQTNYDVRVSAANTAGGSGWSPKSTFATTDRKVPATPADPILESSTHSSLTVSWTAPDDNGLPITRNYLQYRRGATGTWIDCTGCGTRTTVTVTGLDPSTEYAVRVRAENEDGRGGWSRDDVTFRTDAALSVADVTASESAGQARFTASLTAPATRDVTMRWTALTGSGDTATAGSDYTASSDNALTIRVGRAQATFDVPISDDKVDEPNETLTVRVALMATGDGVSLLDDTAQATITDDDRAPVLTMNAHPEAIDEDGGVSTVTVSTGTGSTFETAQTITLALSGTATEGTDYTPSAKTLTLPAGRGAQASSVTATLTALDDTLDEDHETVTIAASRGAESVGTAATITLIDDDDTPEVRISGARAVEGNPLAFEVTLSSASVRTVTVEWRTELFPGIGNVEPTDFTPVSRTRLTFLPGETTKTVFVNTVDDTHDEDEEIFRVRLTLPSDANATLASPTYARAIIRDDDDPPGLVVVGARVDEGDPDPGDVANGSFPFRVTLSEVSEKRVRFKARRLLLQRDTATSSDVGSPSPGLFDIAPGQSAAVVGVPIPDDDIDEPGETFTLELYQPQNATLTTARATVTIEDDDDAPAVTLHLSENPIGEENGSTTVTATLSHPSSQPTTMMVSAVATAPASAADFALSSNTTLTIPAEERESTGRVTVTAVPNLVDTPDKHVTVRATARNTQGIVGNPADLTLTVTDDDERGLAWVPETLEVREGGFETFTVVLTSKPTATVTVTLRSQSDELSLSERGAVAARVGAGADYELTFTPDNWNVPQMVQAFAEPDTDGRTETTVVRHEADGGDYAGYRAEYQATMTDADPPSRNVVLSVNQASIPEGGDAVTLTVTASLDGATLSSPVTVNVTVEAGTAQAVDFTASPSTFSLTIPADAGTASETLMLMPVDDAFVEDNETVTVTGTTTATVEGSAVRLGVTPAVVTITDDDTRAVVVSESTLTVGEGDDGMYTVVLSTVPTGTVTVTPSVTGSPDVTVSPPTLKFTTTDWGTPKTVTVSAAHDSDADVDEATVTHAVTGADYGSNSVTAPDVDVTVTDDDTRAVVVSESTLTVGEGDDGMYTVVLSTVPTGTVTVTPSVTGSLDVTVSPPTLKFTTTDWGTPKTVTVSAAHDSDADVDEATVTHAVTGADYGSNSVTAPDVDVTVTDDDTRAVVVSESTLTVGEGDDGMYTVVLSTVPTGTVTVTPSVTGSPDVTVSPPTLKFTTTDWGTPKTVTVSAAHDSDADVDEATVTHAVTGADYGSNSVTASDVDVNVTDDDTRAVVVSESTLTVGEGDDGMYTVVLSTVPTGTVTVTPSVTGSPDVTVSPPTLEFTTTDWGTPKTVTVSAAHDSDADVDEATVTHAVTGADYGSNSVTASDVGVTVTDDDERSLVVSQTSLEVNENDSASYTVALSSQPNGAVTVTPSVTDNPDVTVSPPTLEFTTTDWSTPKRVTVSAADDPDAEDDGATVTHAASGSDYEGVSGGTVSVEVRDDDEASQVVRLTVSPAAVEEDAGARDVTVTAMLDGATRTVAIDVAVTVVPGTASASDFAPVADFTVTIPALAPSGSKAFRFAPVADRLIEGAAETVTVGGTAPELRVDPATLSIADDDERRIVVQPEALTVDEGGNTTYTVALGSRPTGPVTVHISRAGSADVTVSPPVLTFGVDDGHEPQEVTVSALRDEDDDWEEASLMHRASGADYDGLSGTTVVVRVVERGICNRTPEVREEIMVRLRQALKPAFTGDCADVTGEWLSRLKSVQVLANFGGLTTLKEGDFLGLSGVESVYVLGHGNLKSLPPGTFEGLDAVEEMWIFENGVERVGAGAFRGLTKLRDLHMGDSRISTLEPGAFAGLTSLESLGLQNNLLETFPLDELEALPRLGEGRSHNMGVYIAGNPGYAKGVELRPASVEVAPGGSATYRMRTTTPPDRWVSSARGMVHSVIRVTAPAGVTVTPSELTFTNRNWFRRQRVTVEAAPDAAPGTVTVSHEVIGPYSANVPEPLEVTVQITGSAQAREVGALPVLRVADAKVREGPGAVLAFAVSLDGENHGGARVEYATADGTATAGADYVRARGTLVFAPEETTKTVEVAVLDDHHDEESETLFLTLSNPQGARIADREATGTIENSDPMPRMWISRFGRTVGSHVVEAVGARLGGGLGEHVEVGGARLEIGGSPPTHEERFGDTGHDSVTVPWGATDPREDGRIERSSLIDREMMMRSAFLVSRGGKDGAPAVSAWGRFAVGEFEADAEDLRLEGDVTTGLLGFDIARDAWLAGAAFALSRGEGSYRPLSGDGKPWTVNSTLTTVSPYARFRMNKRVMLWGLAGLGSGTLSLRESGSTGVPIRTGMAMRMGAVGVKGTLLRPSARNGMELDLQSDAMWVRTESDAVKSRDADNLAAASADVTRIRLILEAARHIALDEEGATLSPTIAIGARHDGGDAETGVGLEAGAGLRYVNPGYGLTVEGSVRGLIAHQESGYDEWGASGSISLDPGASRRGLSLSVTPSYGNVSDGTERLWGVRDAGELRRDGDVTAKPRLEARIGYGFPAFGDRFTSTPEFGLALSDTEREYGLGWRLSLARKARIGFELSPVVVRRESLDGDREPDHGVGLRLRARW